MQDLSADFSTPEGARKVVKLKAFSKFENTTEALAAAAALVDSKLSKGGCLAITCANPTFEHCSIECMYSNSLQYSILFTMSEPFMARLPATGLKKFLKKNAEGDTLAVLDSKLGNIIKEKLNIPCIFRYVHICICWLMQHNKMQSFKTL